MLEVLVSQSMNMSLAEGAHTLLFTLLVIGGAVCCLRRPKRRLAARPTMPMRVRKPKLVR